MKSKSLDNPSINDNRNYIYTDFSDFERDDYKYIVEMVDPNSTIVDLGCGNGALIQKLVSEKNVRAKGVELSDSGVKICLEKGLDVIQGRIDEPLSYSDNEFDYSICNVTIQMVMYPEVLLKEMQRVSKYQIISFPNFAFYKNRIDILLNGRMPRNGLFGYNWYDTGHIHQLSIKDFISVINHVEGLEIVEKKSIKSGNPVKDLLIRIFPNLFEQIPVFLLRKTQ
ncbi:MAG: methionine biosynthesis protein MetW [Ignavibacteria bacterium]|nr:methionine biosynthesis protein MetW [Ignavibacteria bacterium]